MKSVLTQRLSLRCKFKSINTVEVVVVDHDTGDCFVHQLAFRNFKEQEVIVPVDVTCDDTESNKVSEDADIDEEPEAEVEQNVEKEAE